MSVYDSFSGGTTFLDNITTGMFQSYGNYTTGVPTGIPLLYAWRPEGQASILNGAQSNPAFSTSAGGYLDLTQPKLSTGFEVINYEIPLDVCRTVGIVTDDPFNCFLSCRDFYGNIMTCGGGSEVIDAKNVFKTPRGASAICSVKIFDAAVDAEIDIGTLNEIELPFASYNAAPVSFVNYTGQPFLGIENDPDTPYKAKPIYKIVKSDSVQTLSSGRARPLFQFIDFDGELPPEFDGTRLLVIGQNISGFGFNIPNKHGGATAFQEYDTNPFLNLGQYVLGLPSYSEGWKGWVQP